MEFGYTLFHAKTKIYNKKKHPQCRGALIQFMQSKSITEPKVFNDVHVLFAFQLFMTIPAA